MQDLIEKAYKSFQSEVSLAESFYNITVSSYDLCMIVSEQTETFGKVELKKLINREEKPSYSPADREVGEIECICEWITVDEYATRTQQNNQEIEKNAQLGLLGKVISKDGRDYIIWPKEYQNSVKKPEFGKKLFSASITQRASFSLNVTTKEELVSAIRSSVKDVNGATNSAKNILNRETYLLLWTAFEQYIKQMAASLFELYPNMVFSNKKYSKEEMSYGEIFEQSNQFTDITELGQYILNSIIGNSDKSNKDSISKTIQFIRDCFLDKSVDPYNTWYVFKGDKEDINYSTIDDIRNIRNTLVHDRGRVTDELNGNQLIKTLEDDYLIVDDELLIREKIILESVAFQIYQSVKKGTDKRAKKGK